MTRRVLAAVLAVTALAVAAFSVPAALAIRRAQERGELLELQREASIVASRAPASGPIDASILDPVIDPSHRLGLYAPTGALLAGDGPVPGDEIVAIAAAGNFVEGPVGEDLVAAVPVRRDATGEYLVMRIEAPRSATRGRFVRSLLVLLTAGVAVVAVAGAAGLWLARRLNRPIDELRRWAATTGPDSDVAPPAPTGIAELDGLRAALVDGRARIEELVRRERSFSSQVSHQLRTPVAAMRVAVETELDAPRPDSTLVLDEALHQLDRLESTITSLLALARHDERPAVATDLRALVDERVEPWRGVAATDARPLEVTGRPVVVELDVDAVGHIVDILVDNAVRHGRGAIRVSVTELDGWAVIDVADEGIHPEHRDPFADQGTDTGHGIGLRLARSLAESSGCRLTLEPEPTTRFRLLIPR